MKLLFLLLSFLLCFSLVKADGGSCGNNCGADVLCYLGSISSQAWCFFTSWVKNAVQATLGTAFSLVFLFVFSNPSFGDEATKAMYTDILFVVESLFVIILLFSAVRLLSSNVMGERERFEAKEDLKKVFLSMFLVWIGYDLYIVAVDLVNAIVQFLAPTSEQWTQAVTSNLLNIPAWFFFIVLFLSFFLFLTLAIVRWLLVYLGVFLLPMAIAFDAFPMTASIGKLFKNMITANFVVQIIDIFLLKILIVLLGNYNFYSFQGIALGLVRVCLAFGLLFLMTFISLGVYFSGVMDSKVREKVMQFATKTTK